VATRALGKLKRYFRGKLQTTSTIGAVLMYHRIAEPESDPWSLCVSPQHFAEHLKVLQQNFHPLSLQEMVQAQRQRQIPKGGVAITFDDGYADNFLCAKPLLEQHDTPATFFIASGCIDRPQEFWSDQLEQIFLLTDRLPETLSLSIAGQQHTWTLSEAIEYPPEMRDQDRQLFPWEAPTDSRLGLYYQVWKLMHPLLGAEQTQILEVLFQWAGVSSRLRPTRRTMTLEELRRLDQGKRIEIGAHTANHPYLPAHSLDLQDQEIIQGRQQLEQWLGHSIRSFAYPYGGYIKQTVKLLSEAGFDYACSTVAEPVWWGSHDLQIPRFEVRDWDGVTFKDHLNRWLHQGDSGSKQPTHKSDTPIDFPEFAWISRNERVFR
jgi:peptidoglycan/xylan/chitin deacetylase (PgdA/CDA1 family)